MLLNSKASQGNISSVAQLFSHFQIMFCFFFEAVHAERQVQTKEDLYSQEKVEEQKDKVRIAIPKLTWGQRSCTL